ncbi:hypothetical protein IGI04_037264, partial [Brassica rapa subsp. trilocularis]
LSRSEDTLSEAEVVLCSRPENVSSFLEMDSLFGPLRQLIVVYNRVKDSRLVYKHYATLYFVLVFDGSENELAMLDLIQAALFLYLFVYHYFLVETLDKCFSNVCELDIVLNYSKMHTVLDEIVFGDQVLETSSTEVIKAVEDISKLEAASNAISLVPKSVSGWRGR